MLTEFGNLVNMDESFFGSLPEQPAPPAATPVAPPPNPEGGRHKGKPVSKNPNPRIHIRRDVVADLLRLGVPDNTTAITAAIGQITQLAIARGQAHVPDLGDITALEAALVDRVAELSRVNAAVLTHLNELGAIAGEASEAQVIQILTRGLSL